MKTISAYREDFVGFVKDGQIDKAMLEKSVWPYSSPSLNPVGKAGIPAPRVGVGRFKPARGKSIPSIEWTDWLFMPELNVNWISASTRYPKSTFSSLEDKALLDHRYRFCPPKDTFMTLQINGRIFDFIDHGYTGVFNEDLMFMNEWKVVERGTDLVLMESDILMYYHDAKTTEHLIAGALLKRGWRLRHREFEKHYNRN
ncbi:hypothetical protein [Vibrio phage BONAISHI]|nr:hypothetical protein [Vibrio phage BONAISHI]